MNNFISYMCYVSFSSVPPLTLGLCECGSYRDKFNDDEKSEQV